VTDHLRVALVQRASSLDPADNRAALALVVPDDADLVVLPEAFQRDFGAPGSDLAPHAEPLDGPFVAAVERVAAARATTVVAGMFEVSDDPARPWNTLVVRGAAHAAYRKIHLYDSFGYAESDRVAAGEVAPTVVEVGGFRLGLMTCYDLRFPELGRLLVDAGAEVLVVPAAWVVGERKVDHWRTLVRARAIENTAYVVAVGQPGPRYTGHSMVVGPLGDVLAEGGDAGETLTAVLTRGALDEARRTNPALHHRRL
jgi:deaminated glutathione amidase